MGINSILRSIETEEVPLLRDHSLGEETMFPCYSRSHHRKHNLRDHTVVAEIHIIYQSWTMIE